MIVDCHGLDFKVLEPILERAKPEKLMQIEDYNPYLTELTGKAFFRFLEDFFNSLELIKKYF
jgi:hypothetical protein